MLTRAFRSAKANRAGWGLMGTDGCYLTIEQDNGMLFMLNIT
jgi:hypothetical protein